MVRSSRWEWERKMENMHFLSGSFDIFKRIPLRTRLILAFVILIISSASATIVIGNTVFGAKFDELASDTKTQIAFDLRPDDAGEIAFGCGHRHCRDESDERWLLSRIALVGNALRSIGECECGRSKGGNREACEQGSGFLVHPEAST